MSSPTYFDWLTLLAILSGPVIGVWVTRVIDRQRDYKRRREAVLEGLLRTRGLELSPDHVGSLNMVPVLFSEAPVRDAYSRVMEALNDGSLGSDNAETAQGAFVRLNAARSDLLREIGHAVGSPLPDKELERHGYAPQAWMRQQNEQDALRALLIEWLEGRRVTHINAGVWEADGPQKPNQIEETPPAPETKKGSRQRGGAKEGAK
ncbi:MAG: hypothetical protein CL949_08370 [Erythrobacter sp.]|mgnify:CR=1 FL=1|nr:hypothetical protein [Erythrobacter sp.]